jgi:hypothetical protein
VNFKVDQAVSYEGHPYRIFDFCEHDGIASAIIFQDSFKGAAPPEGTQVEEQTVYLHLLT